jgi:hypothetical protein
MRSTNAALLLSIGLLVAASTCLAFSYVYHDSLVNRDIDDFIGRDKDNSKLFSIKPIGPGVLDSLAQAKRYSRILLKRLGGKTELAEAVSVQERALRLGGGAAVPFDSLRTVVFVSRRKAANLLWGFLGGAVLVGAQAAMWQGIDYAYNKHFDTRQVLTLSLGSGVLIGLAAAFSRESTVVNFNMRADSTADRQPEVIVK